MYKKLKEIKSAYKSKAKQFSDLTNEQKEHFKTFKLLSWQTYLYPRYQKSKAWYVFTLLLVVALAAYGILTNSWTFSVVVIIAAAVYYASDSQENPLIEVIVSDMGVKVGNRVYPYTEIGTFWIDHNPPYVNDVHLVMKNQYKQDITIQIHNVNPSQIRLVLSKYLPEWKEREKNLGESITNALGL